MKKKSLPGEAVKLFKNFIPHGLEMKRFDIGAGGQVFCWAYFFKIGYD